MHYNEEFIYSKIKRHQESISYLLSVLGNTSAALSSLIQRGTADPNVAGVVPANPAVGGFYDQVDADGHTVTLWIWKGAVWE